MFQIPDDDKLSSPLSIVIENGGDTNSLGDYYYYDDYDYYYDEDGIGNDYLDKGNSFKVRIYIKLIINLYTCIFNNRQLSKYMAKRRIGNL